MIRLLLPVVFPSWRFFSGIGPSPRIQYGFIEEGFEAPHAWHSFRAIPPQLTWRQAITRLFYNPVWNETLFMHSCAEHVFEQASSFHAQEIMRRLLEAVERGELSVPAYPVRFMYRLLAVVRDHDQLVSSVAFVSESVELPVNPLSSRT